jgi:crossover junction endodeoxyribonuclease RusA
MIQFSVEGRPVPQGSMRYIGNGRMIHNKAKELAVWRATIAHKAQEAGCVPIDGPIAIKLRFRMQKPKSVKRDFPIVAPDLDKLIRAVLDGLTNVAYNDDSQVIDIIAQKVYSEIPGVDVEVSDGFDTL